MNKGILFLGSLVLIIIGIFSGMESFTAVGNGLLWIGLAVEG